MPWRGFEPRRLSALPPQDSVSTSFTTRAWRGKSIAEKGLAVNRTGSIQFHRERWPKLCDWRSCLLRFDHEIHEMTRKKQGLPGFAWVRLGAARRGQRLPGNRRRARGVSFSALQGFVWVRKLQPVASPGTYERRITGSLMVAEGMGALHRFIWSLSECGEELRSSGGWGNGHKMHRRHKRRRTSEYLPCTFCVSCAFCGWPPGVRRCPVVRGSRFFVPFVVSCHPFVVSFQQSTPPLRTRIVRPLFPIP